MWKLFSLKTPVASEIGYDTSFEKKNIITVPLLCNFHFIDVRVLCSNWTKETITCDLIFSPWALALCPDEIHILLQFWNTRKSKILAHCRQLSMATQTLQLTIRAEECGFYFLSFSKVYCWNSPLSSYNADFFFFLAHNLYFDGI